MQLHPKARSRLLGALLELLPTFNVYNRQMIVHQDVLRADNLLQILPERDRDTIKDYISDTPISDLVFNVFIDFVKAKGLVANDTSEPLGQIVELDVEQIAEEVVRKIEALPLLYRVASRMPRRVSDIIEDGAWALSEQVLIVKGAGFEEVCGPYLAKFKDAPPGYYKSLTPAQMLPDGAYLVVQETGFMDDIGYAQPYQRALERTRAVYGVMIALGIVEYFHDFHPRVDRAETFVVEVGNGMPRHVYSGRVGASFSRLLTGLRPYNRADWARSSVDGFAKLRRFLVDPADTDRRLLAAQWLFDSYSGDDPLLQFVQAMVSLEILTGEENPSSYEKIGIGELMRNRIAYLIGRDIEDRRKIMGEFNRLYNLRSQIVHRGHNRFSHEDRVKLGVLRSYCARVIMAEAKLLPALGDEGEEAWRRMIKPGQEYAGLLGGLEGLTGVS